MKILDASVVIKVLLTEPDSEKAKQLLQEKVMVSDIIFVEIANTLATKTDFPAEKIKQGLELVYKLDLKVESTTQETLVKAASLSREKGTAVYDMIYAVLAQKKKVSLVTADRKFKQKVNWNFVKLLG